MYNKSVTCLGLAILMGCSSIASPTTPESAPLSWLTGCWQHLHGSTKEIWTQSYDGLLFGHSVTMSAGQVSAFEDLRIEPRTSKPVLSAYVNGSPAVEFVQTTTGSRSVTFENSAHDFPQRIQYARVGSTLTATISLLDGGNAISIPMRQCQ